MSPGSLRQCLRDSPGIEHWLSAWLGHVSLDTTNIYAEVDLAMKAKALGACSIPDDSRRHWRKEPGLMAFLRSL